jgi:uncharacterized membrane protein
MLVDVVWIFLITLVPGLELRASIPYGIVSGMHWALVYVLAVFANILLAFFVWWFVNYVMQYFLRVAWIRKLYNGFVIRTRRKVEPYIEKYGVLGLGLFIGVPLPGSGVYSGGLGAYLLGFEFKDYLKASVLGVLIAGTVVTILVVTGVSGFDFFLKVI